MEARGYTYRRVRRLVVDVDECAADVGQNLELVLELLAQIVRLPKRRVRVHDDVNLDVVVLNEHRQHPLRLFRRSQLTYWSTL